MPQPTNALFGILVLLATMTLPVAANAASGNEMKQPRYEFRKIDAGTLRFDRHNGTVELCDKKGPAWICSSLEQMQESMDQQTALLDEISRLATHNEQQAKDLKALQGQLASMSQRLEMLEKQATIIESDDQDKNHEKAPASAQEPAKEREQIDEDRSAKNQQSPKAPLETDEDAQFDEFLQRSEQLFRRFFGMVKEFKRDLEDERA